MLGGIEQSHHPGLDEIVDLDVRRHAAHEVIGDALDEIGMPQDEFMLWELIGWNVLIGPLPGGALLCVGVV
jgi:hypothetical protein